MKTLDLNYKGQDLCKKKKRSDGGDPELNDYSSGEPLLHHLQWRLSFVPVPVESGGEKNKNELDKATREEKVKALRLWW